MLYISLIPLLGHSLIFFDINCESEPSIIEKIVLGFGLTFFGMGIGSYYSVSFPAVGLSVPQRIRGNYDDIKVWHMPVWLFFKLFL